MGQEGAGKCLWSTKERLDKEEKRTHLEGDGGDRKKKIGGSLLYKGLFSHLEERNLSEDKKGRVKGKGK